MNYFKPITNFDENNTEQDFSMRFAMLNHYFHRSFDEVTAEKKSIRDKCPKPRITAFCNGSLFFPYEERHEFLKHVAYDVESNSTTYWNQIAYEEDGMRLVIDIDSEKRVLSDSEINKIGIVLWKTLSEYYTDFKSRPIEVLGSKCGPRMKKGNLSVGLHFVCHVSTTIEEAQQIIYGFKLRLLKNQWINMTGLDVDTSIYKVNARMVSLRMVYSSKIEDCVVCGNLTEKRLSCLACERRGLMVSRFNYEPVLAVDGNGSISVNHFAKLHGDFKDIIRNHSIWSEESDHRTDYCKPPLDPIFTVSDNDPIEDDTAVNGKKRKRSETPAKVPKGTPLKITDASYNLVEEYIRKINWQGQKYFDGVNVDNIVISKGNRSAQIFISGIGSSFCIYAMKDHGSNRVWFSLNKKGILTFYCNSKKKEYGCKEMERIKFEMPLRISNMVFGIKTPMLEASARREKDTDVFDMQKFIQKAPTSNQNARTVDNELQKQLKYLSGIYGI